jgi:small subunit ribosomal protein S16
VAVKIRLKRLGKIRAPYYRIVVADSRAKRDGRSIEEIGKYHPTEEPSFIEVNSERAQYWLGVGAQPSPQVEAILKLTGDWGIFKGDKNAKSTVKTKEAKVGFQVDEKKKPVLKPKSEKPVAVSNAAAKLDGAADLERAAEVEASSTVTQETPAEVENSSAPAAAASIETAEELADDIADVTSDGAAEEAPAADADAAAATGDDAAADESTASADAPAPEATASADASAPEATASAGASAPEA